MYLICSYQFTSLYEMTIFQYITTVKQLSSTTLPLSSLMDISHSVVHSSMLSSIWASSLLWRHLPTAPSHPEVKGEVVVTCRRGRIGAFHPHPSILLWWYNIGWYGQWCRGGLVLCHRGLLTPHLLPLLLFFLACPSLCRGVGVVVRHGHVDVELDVRVILLGEKHGVKFGLQEGLSAALCLQHSNTMSKLLEGEQKSDIIL